MFKGIPIPTGFAPIEEREPIDDVMKPHPDPTFGPNSPEAVLESRLIKHHEGPAISTDSLPPPPPIEAMMMDPGAPAASWDPTQPTTQDSSQRQSNLSQPLDSTLPSHSAPTGTPFSPLSSSPSSPSKFPSQPHSHSKVPSPPPPSIFHSQPALSPDTGSPSPPPPQYIQQSETVPDEDLPDDPEQEETSVQ